MHIIIGGGGETGSFIAEELSKKNTSKYTTTVIDKNYRNTQKINQQFNVATICGSITNFQLLKQAITKETKTFIACTPDEETNLLSCILAHSMGVARNIAVTHSPIYNRPVEIEKYRHSGVDPIINTTGVIQDEVLKLASFAAATQVSDFAEGKVVMYGIIVTEDFALLNKYINQISSTSGFLIGSIWRNGKSYIPRGNWKIEKNDHLFLLIPKQNINKLKKQLAIKSIRNEKIVIFGSFPLKNILIDKLLSKGFAVTAICKNQNEKDLLQQNLHHSKKKKCKISLGSALDLETQKKAGVDKSFLFLAMTDNETHNINACMVAKHLGAKKTVAIINRQDFLATAQMLGVDVSLATRVIVNRLLQKHLHYEDYSADFTTIADTEMEVFSLDVASDSVWVNKKIKEINLPTNSLIGILISKKGEVIIPRGDSKIKAADKIIFFTMPENLLELKKLALATE